MMTHARRRAALAYLGVPVYALRESPIEKIKVERLFKTAEQYRIEQSSQVEDVPSIASASPSELQSAITHAPTERRDETVLDKAVLLAAPAMGEEVSELAESPSIVQDASSIVSQPASTPLDTMLPNQTLDAATEAYSGIKVDRFALVAAVFGQGVLLTEQHVLGTPTLKTLWDNMCKAVGVQEQKTLTWPFVERMEWQRQDLAQAGLDGFVGQWSDKKILVLGKLPNGLRLTEVMQQLPSLAAMQNDVTMKKMAWNVMQGLI